ncbi:phosphatidylglycerophosphatase and protein-tyrosine phosphatase 1-like isoform X1 [Apostichopus japonicus]|uniref:phosphatidylglycerophosphatase and protein-tyrosine phosphatase 1-like isoform X1 n=1 Tax=Stichopus japonicus TaxID=307972 RepID=UPI003AB256B0
MIIKLIRLSKSLPTKGFIERSIYSFSQEGKGTLVNSFRNTFLPLYFKMGGFYPSLFYNVVMSKVSSRNWYDRMDENIIVGAMPFKSDVEKLMKDENVKAVISLCEGHEHKRFVARKEDWDNAGVDYLSLPTVDYSSPSMENIDTGIEFMKKHAEQDSTVYVHCKAGRTRSVTLVGCYLIQKRKWTPSNSKNFLEDKRPHVVLQDLHFRAMYRYYDKNILKAKREKGKEGSNEDLNASQ